MKLVLAVVITRMIARIFDKNKTKKEVFQTGANVVIEDPAAFRVR